MNEEVLPADCKDIYDQLHKVFNEQYSNDMRILTEQCLQLIPEWEDARENRLSNDDICRRLIGNTEGYPKIGGMVEAINESNKLLKQVWLVVRWWVGPCNHSCASVFVRRF